MTILNCCARITGHRAQYRLLADAVADVADIADWHELLRQAERQGLVPLLHHHLVQADISIPSEPRRSMEIMVKIHSHQSRVRQIVLCDMLQRFGQAGLSPLVIKGAALGYTLYPAPSLRPMRDIDLLFRPAEAAEAQKVALSAGFSRSSAPTPSDHHHLPSLLKRVGGMKVCLEIHRGLYPDCPPYYSSIDIDRLLAAADPFIIDTMTWYTLSREDTLSYLFQHGFRMPISYEPYRLINAADLIGFVEKHFNALNWPRLRAEEPGLCAALSVMHHLTPWDPACIPDDFVHRAEQRVRRRPQPYRGWPQRKIRQFKQENVSLRGILAATFFPPSWWVKVYYGGVHWWQMVWCLCYRHPRHIFWWIKLYYSLAIVAKGQGGIVGGPGENHGEREGGFRGAAHTRRIVALTAKLAEKRPGSSTESRP